MKEYEIGDIEKPYKDFKPHRVIAIESKKGKVVHSFGEGVYVGDEFVKIPYFRNIPMFNPRIEMDNGSVVYGYESHWGRVDKIKEAFYDGNKIKLITKE